jgi:S1-C subfamily serine protease
VCLALFILVSFAAGCTPYLNGGMDGEYDSSHIFLDSIDKTMAMVAKSVYRIETITIFKVGNELSTLKVAGMGFSIDNRHILTAKHVTSIDNYQVQTPFGVMVFPLSQEDKIRETTSLVFDNGSRDPVKVIYRDNDLDFALLETEKGITSPAYSIGNSDDFRVMDVVIVPANFQTGLSIRLGYVTQLDFIQYGEKGEVAKRTENIFGISAVVSEGDSGSPILFLRDGKVELGGLVSFIVLPARGLGYGLKINPILERLRSDNENQMWVIPLMRDR